MMKLSVLTIFVIMLVSCSKKDEDTTTINGEDANFMVQAAYSNLAEIAAGHIADSLGSIDSIQVFGNRMITGHSAAEASLDSLAAVLNLSSSLPAMPDSAHIAQADSLKTLTGHTFDSTYISGQVTDHTATVFLFQRELAGGNNEQIKSFASVYLPIIQMHLTEATAIQALIK